MSFQTGKSSTTKARITTSSTSVKVADVTSAITNGSFLLQNQLGTAKEWTRGTLASGTLTFSFRGLSQTASVFTTVAANKKEWKAGTIVKLVAMHNDLIDKDDDEQTFGSGADTDFTLFFKNGDTNSPFVRYVAASNAWVFSNDGVSTSAFNSPTGVATASGGVQLVVNDVSLLFDTNPGLELNGNNVRVKADASRALSRDANGVGLDLHATNPALEFDSSQIRVKNHTAAATKLLRDANGIGIDVAVAPTWTAAHTFNNTVNIATATNFQLSGTAFAGTMARMNFSAGTIARTSGEALDASAGPLLVYQDASTGKVLKTDANDTTKIKQYGFVEAGQNVAIDTSTQIQFAGIVGGFTGLTRGLTYYMGDTPGAIVASPSTGTGSQKIVVGVAESTTELRVVKLTNHDVRAITISSGSNVPITLGWRPRYVIIHAVPEVVITVAGATSAAQPIGSGYSDGGTDEGATYRINSTPQLVGGATARAWNVLDENLTKGSRGTATLQNTGYTLVVETYSADTELVIEAIE